MGVDINLSDNSQQSGLPAWFKGDKQRAAFMTDFVKLEKAEKRRVFLFGVPEHGNLGDQSIVIAMRKFVNCVLPDVELIEITERQLDTAEMSSIRDFVKPDDLLLLMGGGNLGDLYVGPALARKKVIKNFPDNPIIMFPQSIYFKDEEKFVDCKQLFASHKNLTLCAREDVSFKLMTKHFSRNTVLLVPDIVFSMPMHEHTRKIRNGAVIVMRTDKESNVVADDLEKLKKLMGDYYESVSLTDTVIRQKSGYSRELELDKKLRQFSEAELIITDRLHSVVFAAMTGTPCIVFPNIYHKVEGTYKWVEYLPYIKMCRTLLEVETLLSEKFPENAVSENIDVDFWGEFSPLVTAIEAVM